MYSVASSVGLACIAFPLVYVVEVASSLADSSVLSA
jgi:hypothetical protein